MTMMSSEMFPERGAQSAGEDAVSSEAPRADASRTGADLRTARERLGWELADVAAGLRIRQPYLQALEDGRLAGLPGNVYAVGFLRTYATALGLDPDEMTKRFRAEAAAVNRKTELTFPAPVPERGVPAGAVILVGAVLAIGAYVGWYRVSGRDMPQGDRVQAVPAELARLAQKAAPSQAPSPTVASLQPAIPPGSSTAAAEQAPRVAAAATPRSTAPRSAPTEVPSVPPTQAAAAVSPTQAVAAPMQPIAAPEVQKPRIVLHATADAWVQVRQKQGPVLLNRILRAGEDWPVPADQSDLLLTTGNAGGTELIVDGVTSAPLGASGAVRRDLPLDADLIKSGGLAARGVTLAKAHAPAPMPAAGSTPRASAQ